MNHTFRKTKATAAHWKIAGNPNATASSLLLLAKHPDWEIRQEVAYHPRCARRALKILIDDEDWVMRYAALRHPKLDGKLLKAYSRSIAPVFRVAVAENPKCPVAILRMLARDPPSFARRSLAVLRTRHAALCEALPGCCSAQVGRQ